jgi:hypothetical protein
VFTQIANLVSCGRSASSLTIISPYITIRPAKAISRVLAFDTKLDIVTRFDHDLFSNGSSSLGALVYLAKRPNTNIYAVDRLHAKIYICGDKALIGSANFTDRGLGFSVYSNLELLSVVDSADVAVLNLLNQVNTSKIHISHAAMNRMLDRLSSEKRHCRAIFRSRVNSILSLDSWLPSCSLRYLLRYLGDGSFYRVPLISRSKIIQDALYLERQFGIRIHIKNAEAIIGMILELPIIQFAIECRIQRNDYLLRCLKARSYEEYQIDALYNWSEFCILETSEDL